MRASEARGHRRTPGDIKPSGPFPAFPAIALAPGVLTSLRIQRNNCRTSGPAHPWERS
jgi:hypothetical protein